MVLKRVLGGTIESGAIITSSGPFHFRRLAAGDLGAVAAHFGQMSEPDLGERFFGLVGRGALETRYLALDLHLNALFGCFDGGHLFAVMQLGLAAFLPEAELGISVEAAYRRCGVGSGLCELGLAAAQEYGVRRVVAFCRPQNRIACRILRNNGFAEDHADPLILAAWRDLAAVAAPGQAPHPHGDRRGGAAAHDARAHGGDQSSEFQLDSSLRRKSSLLRLSQCGWR